MKEKLVTLFNEFNYYHFIAENGKDNRDEFNTIIFYVDIGHGLEYRFSFDFDNKKLSLVEHGVYHVEVEKFMNWFHYWVSNDFVEELPNTALENEFFFHSITLGTTLSQVNGSIFCELGQRKTLSFVKNELAKIHEDIPGVISSFNFSMINPLKQDGFNEKINYLLLMKYIKYWDFNETILDVNELKSIWEPFFAIENPFGRRSLGFFLKYHSEFNISSLNLNKLINL